MFVARKVFKDVQMGSIESHFTLINHVKPSSAKLLECTKVIFRDQFKKTLLLSKALLIGDMKPYAKKKN